MHPPYDTRKLYWEDSFLTDFKAKVTEIEATGDSTGLFRVQLDQTAFYPEGGGQPADQGWLNDFQVIHVEAKDEKVWHILSSDNDCTIHAGDMVIGTIDWIRRFDHMQQHLGQHLLSAVLYKDWNANTIGFHLGENTVTIDLDRNQFHSDNYREIENAVNQLVFRNLPVTTCLISTEEYNRLKLRKTPELTDPVRIVAIEGVDHSACSGTHPSMTGSIGPVKILKTEAYKGGTRITFVCGQRALLQFQLMQQELDHCSTLLSAGRHQILTTLTSHLQDYQHLKKSFKTLQTEWCHLEGQRLMTSAISFGHYRVIRQIYASLDAPHLQSIANILKSEANSVALLATTAPSVRFVFINTTDISGLSIKELMMSHLHHIEGKGGGNAVSAQGGGTHKAGLPLMFDALEADIKKWLHEASIEERKAPTMK
ncbi:alanyl-tRNA editing protein [Anoxynatronum sibiricum]|uniref:Alanine--tRNA ligase-related protein n=1 Tax=Anoxynatronum sibiricum TaxID=210623 RepID=A0ABU9VRE7_9CLOT